MGASHPLEMHISTVYSRESFRSDSIDHDIDIAEMACSNTEERKRLDAALAKSRSNAEERERLDAALAMSRNNAEERKRLDAALAMSRSNAEERERLDAALAMSRSNAEERERLDAALAMSLMSCGRQVKGSCVGGHVTRDVTGPNGGGNLQTRITETAQLPDAKDTPHVKHEIDDDTLSTDTKRTRRAPFDGAVGSERDIQNSNQFEISEKQNVSKGKLKRPLDKLSTETKGKRRGSLDGAVGSERDAETLTANQPVKKSYQRVNKSSQRHNIRKDSTCSARVVRNKDRGSKRTTSVSHRNQEVTSRQTDQCDGACQSRDNRAMTAVNQHNVVQVPFTSAAAVGHGRKRCDVNNCHYKHDNNEPRNGSNIKRPEAEHSYINKDESPKNEAHLPRTVPLKKRKILQTSQESVNVKPKVEPDGVNTNGSASDVMKTGVATMPGTHASAQTSDVMETGVATMLRAHTSAQTSDVIKSDVPMMPGTNTSAQTSDVIKSDVPMMPGTHTSAQTSDVIKSDVPMMPGTHTSGQTGAAPLRPFAIDPRQSFCMLADIQRALRQDEDGDLPLHIAVVQCNTAMSLKLIRVMVLADKGLNIYNNLRQTPLHLAVLTNQADIVSRLLDAGSQQTMQDRNGQTAAHLAVTENNMACLKVILRHSDITHISTAMNYEGMTALHLAITHGRNDMAKTLMAHNVNIDIPDGKSGRTALFHAAETNNGEIVELLLNHGACADTANYSGTTPVQAAAGRGHNAIVAILSRFNNDYIRNTSTRNHPNRCATSSPHHMLSKESSNSSSTTQPPVEIRKTNRVKLKTESTEGDMTSSTLSPAAMVTVTNNTSSVSRNDVTTSFGEITVNHVDNEENTMEVDLYTANGDNSLNLVSSPCDIEAASQTEANHS